MKSITRFTKNIRGNQCLNCGTHLTTEDNFCNNCGQVNDTNRLSVKQYFSEFLSGFLDFDNRFLKTVIPLVFKPGFVTKEYVDGKRMKYVNPFQLYLHISILFFLVIGIFGTIDKFKPSSGSSSEVLPALDNEELKIDLDSLKSETLDELKKSNVEIDSTALSYIDMGVDQITQNNKDSIKSRINKIQSERENSIFVFVDSVMSDSKTMQIFGDHSISSIEKDSLMGKILLELDKKSKQLTKGGKDVMVDDWIDIVDGWTEISKKGVLKKKGIKRMDSIFIDKGIDYQIPLPLIRISNENPNNDGAGELFTKIKTLMDYQKEEPKESALVALDNLGYEKSYWNVFLYSKSTDWNEAVEDPENYGAQFMDRILSRVSVALFLLLPIFTLIVSLIYIRRKYNYTENLVFVFHAQTVFFLLLLLFLIVNRFADSNLVIVIFTLTFMLHLYKSMRQFYQQGRFKTIIKYFILNLAFLVMSLIGGVIISFLAFLI
ncbi:DUF3667 domain-containing protein [Lutimonas zeaxanthinifaciens]|uniref:DUF3667 domain-containing protein n=1 Tax=Lutimonas zeaxanthinifaciens TaxID=3060215 RepID=UPI00265D1758|nr:DUF3667 domain-containing protein [Lutimonas sp. YSD2104]WKK65560.1 DUF3667 domain-containing protein [Lutimonas sp. YSD2104]